MITRKRGYYGGLLSEELEEKLTKIMRKAHLYKKTDAVRYCVKYVYRELIEKELKNGMDEKNTK